MKKTKTHSEISLMGAKATMKKHGLDHFSRMGKASAKARKLKAKQEAKGKS